MPCLCIYYIGLGIKIDIKMDQEEVERIGKNVEKLIRGYLVYLGYKHTIIHLTESEMYRTKSCGIILSDENVSFKVRGKVTNILFTDIQSFSFTNSDTFIFRFRKAKALKFTVY